MATIPRPHPTPPPSTPIFRIIVLETGVWARTVSLYPHLIPLHSPPPPHTHTFSPSLISLMVSVDDEHRVYFLVQ